MKHVCVAARIGDGEAPGGDGPRPFMAGSSQTIAQRSNAGRHPLRVLFPKFDVSWLTALTAKRWRTGATRCSPPGLDRRTTRSTGYKCRRIGRQYRL